MSAKDKNIACSQCSREFNHAYNDTCPSCGKIHIEKDRHRDFDTMMAVEQALSNVEKEAREKQNSESTFSKIKRFFKK